MSDGRIKIYLLKEALLLKDNKNEFTNTKIQLFKISHKKDQTLIE